MLLENLHAISIIASTIVTLVTGGLTCYGYIRRGPILNWFRNRVELVNDLHVTEHKLAEYTERALAAERLVDTYKPMIDLVTKQLEALRLEFTMTIQPLQAKVDGMVDWTHLAIEALTTARKALTAAGLPLDGVMIPEIPPIMKDRFNIPETLREPLP